MTFTPQDIQSKQFHVRMRGFDVEEVDGFLEKVAEEFLIITLESKQALERIAALEKTIESYKSKESSFQHAILSAQKISDEMVARSKKDADEILTKAKNEALRLSSSTQKEADDLMAKVKTETADLQSQVQEETATLKNQAETEAKVLKDNAVQEAKELKTRTEDELAKLKAGTKSSLANLQDELTELKTLKSRIQDDLKQMLHNYLSHLEDAVPEGLAELSTEATTTFRPADEPDTTTNTPAPDPALGTAAPAKEDIAEDDLSDLYEKINIIEEGDASVAIETAAADEAAATDLADIPAENLAMPVDVEDGETLETVDLGDLTLDDPKPVDPAKVLMPDFNPAADEIDLNSIPDLDDSAIPDLDGDMLVELQDPLDDLEPAISIAGRKNM